MTIVNNFIYFVPFNWLQEQDENKSVQANVNLFLEMNFERKIVDDPMMLLRPRIFKYATIVPSICLLIDFSLNKIKIPKMHFIANIAISALYFATLVLSDHGLFYNNLVWSGKKSANYSILYNCTAENPNIKTLDIVNKFSNNTCQ